MSFRLIATADLHFDVLRSHEPARGIIDEINATDADAVLLAGDTATADAGGEFSLEACLGLFRTDRPNLFLPGNHEYWSRTRRIPHETLLQRELPQRVERAGWHWLPAVPFSCADEVAVVGAGGWYDYSFAEPRLKMPEGFYEAHVSPAAADRLGMASLIQSHSELPAIAEGFFARWNDGRRIADPPDDREFAAAELERLAAQIAQVGRHYRIIAATHVCPHAGLLPKVPGGPIPDNRRKFAFARAFLGCERLGQLLSGDRRIQAVVCGHTHARRGFEDGGRRWVNIGSTYTEKRFEVIELD